MNIRRHILRISRSVDQGIRIIGMQFILTPAAYVLPRKLAIGIAYVITLLVAILPVPGFRSYWEIRRAFGKSSLDSFFLTWVWLGRPLQDFVILKRLVYGRENLFNGKIVERNAEGINNLRESGESYIVVGGHFAKKAYLSVLSPGITYGRPIQVGSPPRKKINSLYDLRIKIQYGAFLRAFSCCGRDIEFVWHKNLHTARTLYTQLRKRGNVVFISIDGQWDKTLTVSYERPFAGSKSRWFSTGAAQIARLAKCSVIGCVALVERDGTVVLEWGTPIRVGGSDEFDDISAMNEFFDTLEKAVGDKPTQYIFEIGGDRRWNSKKKRWEDLPDQVIK